MSINEFLFFVVSKTFAGLFKSCRMRTKTVKIAVASKKRQAGQQAGRGDAVLRCLVLDDTTVMVEEANGDCCYFVVIV